MSGVIYTEGRVLNAGRRVATARARITDAKDRLLAHMRRRRALCSNFRRGARKADVELEGRQSDSLMSLAPRMSEFASRAAADCISLQIPAPTIRLSLMFTKKH